MIDEVEMAATRVNSTPISRTNLEEAEIMYSLVLMMAFSPGADPVSSVPDGSTGQGIAYQGNCTGHSHGGFLHKFHAESNGCCGGSHHSFFGKLHHKSDSFGCNGGYIVNSPAIAPPATVPPKPLPAGESIPSPKEKKQANAAGAAQIVVELPADAQLFVDEEPTRGTSARRTLVTPTLQPGLLHTYTLRVEVTRDGKSHSELKRVEVTAGETAQVFFRSQPSQSEPNEVSRAAHW